MADTNRTLTALQALLPDNTSRAISAQDLRDFLVSAYGSRYVTTISSTPVTLDDDDDIVLADANGGAITVNLPASASNTHKTYTIKKIDSSGNAVTLDGNGSETIDGSTTHALSGQYDSVTIVCDGTEWHIIGEST